MKHRLWLGLCATLISILSLAVPALAHEVRPAYLQLRQLDAERYDVLWKVPGLGEEKRLALDVKFPPGTRTISSLKVSFADNAFIQRWRVQRAGGLDGASMRIGGLPATLTDVLVRLERLDGTTQTIRVTPTSPEFVIKTVPGRWDVARTYLGLGVEHILLGIDHLLFVLALLILVDGTRRLLLAITAFTVAHSLTLAAATLGWIRMSPPPVEASIALSIVFLAGEIMHARAGHPGLTYRQPWIVAFLFGLLHGLGFAGALGEVGLPPHAIPVALLFFNVGVEIGQLLFITTVLAAIVAARRVRLPHGDWSWKLPVYAIGAVAAYWTIDRATGL